MNKQTETFLQLSCRLASQSQEGLLEEQQPPITSPVELQGNIVNNVHNISNGTITLIWNQRQIILFTLPKVVKYSVSFRIQPISKSYVIQSLEKHVEKPKISITYALATRKNIVVGSNFGNIMLLPGQLTKKIHAGEVSHLSERNKFILTCSSDCTAYILEEKTLKMKFMLKDHKYMKEPLLRGHWVDDFRVAVASKLFVKVYSLQHHAFRIIQTIFHVELPNTSSLRLQFSKDILLYNTEKHIKMVVLQRLQGKPAVATLDLQNQRVDCFCLMDNGQVAIYDDSKKQIRGVKIENGEVTWKSSLDKTEIKKAVSHMEFAAGHVYVFDEKFNCLKIKVV